MHAEAASLSHDDFETNLKALCSSGIQSIKRHSFGDFDDAGIKIFSGANAVKNLLKFEYKVLVSAPAADAPLCIVWDDHYTLYTLELLSHTTNVACTYVQVRKSLMEEMKTTAKSLYNRAIAFFGGAAPSKSNQYVCMLHHPQSIHISVHACMYRLLMNRCVAHVILFDYTEATRRSYEHILDLPSISTCNADALTSLAQPRKHSSW